MANQRAQKAKPKKVVVIKASYRCVLVIVKL